MRTRNETACEEAEWIFPCTHPDFLIKGVSHDFSILATGAGDEPPQAAIFHSWKGGFTGRPELLRDLWPTLCANLGGGYSTWSDGQKNRASILLEISRCVRGLHGLEEHPIQARS